MRPLPAQQGTEARKPGDSIPSLPGPVAPSMASFSSSNRRTHSCASQRAYPWLLSASTATAALFCLMYITKPVIVPASDPAQTIASPPKPALSMQGATPGPASLMPSANSLPGERPSPIQSARPIPADPRSALPGPPSNTAFEETNLRVQHILTAEAPGGHKDRIDIDVPVLYQSRSLRWTNDEVAEARKLLLLLMDYQEKSRQLRSEGVALLDSWNHLVGESIPSTQLRADSPTLPENQQDAADAPRPADLITTESIQIQPSGK